jgi:PAS domain S-box-containing protein
MKRFYNSAVQPHPRITDIEERRGARLFSGLMLVHFALVLFAINGMNLLYLQRTGQSILNSHDAWIVLGGLAIIGVAFLLLRRGFYRPAVIVYIIDTVAVALWAPFVQTPSAEIGLLASATIPLLLTAMVFSYRWVAGVLLGTIAVGAALLSFASLPLGEMATGYSLLIIVAVTGGLILVLKHHLDSTEKDRHSQVRKVAAKYQNLFNSVADGIFIVDDSGHIVETNSAACKQLGYAREELIGLPVTSISARSDFDFGGLLSELRRTGQLTYQTNHQRKDRSTFPVELRLTLVEHQGDVNILGVARDVTEQQAELSFREAVISHAAEGLCVCHQVEEFPYLEFSLWNKRMYEITGYTLEEINRLGWYQTVYPDLDLQARAIDRISEMRQGKQLLAEEWLITSKDGRKRNVEISTSMLRTNDSHEHVLALMHDVTKRRQFEQDLSESEKRYRELFDSVMEGIGLADKDEKIVFANPAFARIFECDSIDEIIGKSLTDYVTAESKETILAQSAIRARGRSSQYELEILTTKGNPRWIYISVTPQIAADGSYVGALGAVFDITERKNSERMQIEVQQKLERAERMESLGLLAGGVAHDLNNMLGPVAGYAELLLHEVPPDSKIAGRIQKIVRSAHDAADVIQDLLTLARRGRYQMTPLQMNDVVRSYLESPGFEELKRRHSDIVVDLDLCPTLGMINGSSPHLSKVIMNLISNAFEAMMQDGSLIIRTEQTYLNSLVGGYSRIEPGQYVLVHVKDAGVGIPQEEMDKIFEPYFSKKKMGRSGSGLGLSVVYGVLKDHHGYYDVFSEPGKGTEFVLYFPVCAVSSVNDSDPTALTGGTQTVLVVDDLIEQRELSHDILSSLGYSVSTAENGHEAIAFLKKQSVDIVLLDMIMEPNFDGLDTYREILRINPGQACIIVSGYAETDRVQEMQLLGAGPYVRKPFNMITLDKAMHEALSEKKCHQFQEVR